MINQQCQSDTVADSYYTWNTFIFNFLFELLQLPAQLHSLLSVRQNDMLTMISICYNDEMTLMHLLTC